MPSAPAWRLYAEESSRTQAALVRLDRLTNQEGQVLAHLIEGRLVREIAVWRVVSEATVRTQIKAVLSKLEVSSQLSAVALANAAHWDVHLNERPALGARTVSPVGLGVIR